MARLRVPRPNVPGVYTVFGPEVTRAGEGTRHLRLLVWDLKTLETTTVSPPPFLKLGCVLVS